MVVVRYVRNPRLRRNVDDLLFERGLDVGHEMVRFGWNRSGPCSRRIFGGSWSVLSAVGFATLLPKHERHLAEYQAYKIHRSAALAERQSLAASRWAFSAFASFQRALEPDL